MSIESVLQARVQCSMLQRSNVPTSTKQHSMMILKIKIDLCSFIRSINIYQRHLWVSNYRIIEFMELWYGMAETTKIKHEPTHD